MASPRYPLRTRSSRSGDDLVSVPLEELSPRRRSSKSSLPRQPSVKREPAPEIPLSPRTSSGVISPSKPRGRARSGSIEQKVTPAPVPETPKTPEIVHTFYFQLAVGILFGYLLYRLLSQTSEPALEACERNATFAALVKPNVFVALHYVLAMLVVASIIVALLRLMSGRGRPELEARMYTWWGIAGALYGVIYVGKGAMVAFWGLVSLLAFREFTSTLPTRVSSAVILALTVLAIPAQYSLVFLNWYGLAVAFIPIFVFAAIPLAVQLTGAPDGFIKTCGTLQYGLIYTVFTLSHACMFLLLPDCNLAGGNAGYMLYVTALTEWNDVAQYVAGKTLHRFVPHKIAPSISPGKTWVGLAGGVVGCICLALVLAPLLTPFGREAAALTGLLVCLSGFVGGLGNSAIKRDIGVKDSGSLLPGHGGILDRVDSLTYAAPLFFHFVRKYYVAGG